MDINQNQQVNTFTKGMNTDTSDALISNEQYRYAENVRPITNTDNNSGELYLIEGTTKTDILNIDEEFTKILAVDSIRNYTVFILYNEKDKKWAIYRSIGGAKAERVFGWSEHNLWELDDDENPIVDKKRISTVLRWESDTNIKLYIANGVDPLLSINIYNIYGDEKTFDDVFGYQSIPVPALDVEISDITGYIDAGVVQYVYRLYSKNGASTTISPLSKPLSLYKTNNEGYAVDAKSARAVKITYPNTNSTTLDYIQIYRINFVQSGQQPKISLIKDQKLIGTSVVDTGVGDIQDIAVSEFLSMMDIPIIPKTIESKNDYLFAANLKYKQDDADKTFEKFESRSYSNGNFIQDDNGSLQNGQGIWQYEIPLDKLRHNSFVNDSGTPINLSGIYNAADWDPMANEEWNGVGPYVRWKYKYSDYYQISVTDQAGTIKDPHRSFRRGEVYRFGIRLFDKQGNATSVKWIADIMMPELKTRTVTLASPSSKTVNQLLEESECDICTLTTELSSGDIFVRDLGIEFQVNLKSYATDNTTFKDFSNLCSGYEIVRCNRTISDKYTITQGITGHPLELYSREYYGDDLEQTQLICPSGFLTQCEFEVRGSLSNNMEYVNNQMYSIPDGYSITAQTPNRKAIALKNILIFGSPEFCYQSDDVKNLIQQYEGSIYVKPITAYWPKTKYASDTGDKYSQPDFVKGEPTGPTIKSKQDDNPDMGYMLWEVDNGYFVNSALMFANMSEENSPKTVYKNNIPSYYFFNYMTPDTVDATIVEKINNYAVSNVSFITSPEYSDFADTNVISFWDNVTTIGDKQFINWSAPLMLNLQGDARVELNKSTNAAERKLWTDWDNKTETYNSMINFYGLGSGGSAILLKLDESRSKIDIPNSGDPKMPLITIENLRKPCAPYGGYNKTSIENSVYYSYGNYTPVEGNSIYTTDVFSGDSRIRMFTYNALHNWYNSKFWQFAKMGTVYAVPIECDIDIQAQFGDLYEVNTTSYLVQDKASAFEGYTQEKDAYLYNTAYNVELDTVSYATDVRTAAETNNYDTRVHYSEVKTNNEYIDSWLQFKAANFLDVDSRFGEITDLKLFKDKLVFWQDHAAGLLSVNERIILNDANDTQVVLGTGGVLERYDYFTTIYGQKPYQHARAISNDSLYWWDGYNKAILQYQNKFEVTPLSTIKTITNYINSGEETNIPELTYDPKFKEVICSVINNNSVVYNEQIQAFSSVYTFAPLFDTLVDDQPYVTDKSAVYKYGEYDEENGARLFTSPAKPLIDYVVNANSTTPKTFDIQMFGGRFYGGSEEQNDYPRTDYRMPEYNNNPLSALTFAYKTPLKQTSSANGKDVVTNVEYDYRLTIPRNNKNNKGEWGDRMRGKTMQCELKSDSNSKDFSLQYVITKFRMSWT